MCRAGFLLQHVPGTMCGVWCGPSGHEVVHVHVLQQQYSAGCCAPPTAREPYRSNRVMGANRFDEETRRFRMYVIIYV